MKVLMTGAGGFVGRRLVQRLAAAGNEVVALVHTPVADHDRSYFDSPGIEVRLGDVTSLDVDTLPDDVDAMVTLAQSNNFRDFPARAEEIFAVNVTANLRLLQWAQRTGVGKVVHASSGGIYGGRSGVAAESESLSVNSTLGFYLGSKLCSEVVLQNYRQFFRGTVILRPFFIFGPRQQPGMLIARLLASVRDGQAITLQGEDGIRLNPVYVDDAAAAFERALGLDGSHVINLGGPDILTLREVGQVIGRAVGREPVFEMTEGVAADYIGDTTSARNKLGPPKVSFEEGIRRTVGA